MSDITKTTKAPTAIATPKFKRGFKGFVSDVSREMKKVNWPTRKETTRLTGIVISLCILLALLLVGMGWVVATLLDLLTTGRI